MKKIFLICVMVLGMALGTSAQTKFDLALNHIVQGQKIEKSRSANKSQEKKDAEDVAEAEEVIASPDTVSVIARLKDGSQLPEASLEKLGITTGFHKGNFAMMKVPVESLQELETLDEFVCLEMNKAQKPINDYSRKIMKVDDLQNEAKAQEAGLHQTFTGKGVVVGVFDTGIDFNHNNFRDPLTHKTRIKKAIIYKEEEPTDYTDPSAIDKLTTDSEENSHGTHTSSTAAGSYAGSYVDKNGKVTYTGVQGSATEADLVLAGSPILYDSNQMDALTKMDEIATSLGEPLVVNLSIGEVGGFLDGKDILGYFMDSFTDYGNKPGRIVCASAGNEGNTNFTIKGNLSSSNSHRISTFIPATEIDSRSSYYLPEIDVYGKDATPFTVHLDFYDMNFNLKSTVSSETLVNGGFLSYETNEEHDGRYAAELQISRMLYEKGINKYYCAVTIESEKDCQFNLFAKAYDSKYRSFEICNLTDNGKAGFTAGTADLSISKMVCTNSLLSVGAWKAQDEFHNYRGESLEFSIEANDGDVAPFSSYTTGDYNGVQRPDFCAPGISVVSGFNSYDTSVWYDGNCLNDEVCGKATEEYLSGHTSIIGAMCGTSMACPNATGVMALWLQKNPNLTVNQIREIVRNSAVNDEYTAAKPVRFGAGKLNALAGLQDFYKQVSLKETDTHYPEVAVFDKAKMYDIDLARTLSAGTWNPLMLPFPMTEDEVKVSFGDGVKLKKLTSFVDNVVNFNDASAIEACEAYIVEPENEVTKVSVTDKTGLRNALDETERYMSLANGYGQRLFDSWTTEGSFYAKDLEAVSETPRYILSNNNLTYVDSKISVDGYRWLIKDCSGTKDARELSIKIDGVVTGINGQAIDVDADRSGKFVRNGRLVILKGGRCYNAAGQLMR